MTRNFWASSVIRPAGTAKVVAFPVKVLNDGVRRLQPTSLIVDIEGGELELFETIDFQTVRKICLDVHKWAIGRAGVRRMQVLRQGAGFHRDPTLSTVNAWFLERRGEDCR